MGNIKTFKACNVSLKISISFHVAVVNTGNYENFMKLLTVVAFNDNEVNLRVTKRSKIIAGFNQLCYNRHILDYSQTAYPK